jgi:hypothetical protein
VREGGAAYLLYALLDRLVDQGFVATEALSEALERLEDQVLDARAGGARAARGAQRELAHLRRVAAATRQLTRHAAPRAARRTRRASSPSCATSTTTPCRCSRPSTCCARSPALHQTYAASVADRTNEVVRVLTLFTAVFMPITFIGGVYGMNFWNMPEVGWRWGYPRSGPLMILVAAGTLSGCAAADSLTHRPLVPVPGELRSATATDALRHVLVTLADRFDHAVDGAPAGFAAFDAGAGVRTPLALVRHLRGSCASPRRSGRARSTPTWSRSTGTTSSGLGRDLRALDALLRAQPLPSGAVGAHQVLQGPLLDAATHVGQLVMLRRMAGAPVGERRVYWQVAMAELDGDGAGGGAQ